MSIYQSRISDDSSVFLVIFSSADKLFINLTEMITTYGYSSLNMITDDYPNIYHDTIVW